MADSKMNDSVGRKIVEALKMQSTDVQEETSVNEVSEVDVDSQNEDTFNNDDFNNLDSQNFSNDLPSDIQLKIQNQLKEPVQPQFQSSYIDNAFQQSLARNLGDNDTFAQVPDDFDYPANVAVLRQLIAKLPAGVSKQTGATIIRQTMEALGISMQAVIQEAKQVQGTLIENSKECQSNILEYKKQIGILESKSQQYKRQSAVMNDIINLFIQS
ncbi:MAG TPA: hypothetical protein DCS44_03425 [Cyanobacteria bacterium UBA10660]|nr:MAG TPA: hypothetical protein CPT83_08435 [Candidatus Gastranaerophilales bacterium HUM_1]HAS93654.1 hypothetical protein [Cyanobacteria bacterium UBA10660]